MILDGGRCDVGVESTVLDLTESVPVVLRPGGVTLEMLESVVGQVVVHPNVMKPLKQGQITRSPGMKYVHYAPKAPVTLIRGDLHKQVEFIDTEASRREKQGERPGILATNQTLACYQAGVRLSMGDRSRPAELAENLFARLREFDALDVTHW